MATLNDAGAHYDSLDENTHEHIHRHIHEHEHNHAPKSLGELLAALEQQQEQIHDNPYDASERLRLSHLYEELGYPDLAAGEAYLALLLVDEITDESGEYHEEALEAFRRASEPLPRQVHELESKKPKPAQLEAEVDAMEDSGAFLSPAWSQWAYEALAKNLLACGCLKSAFQYCMRGLEKHDFSLNLLNTMEETKRRVTEHFPPIASAKAESGGTWDGIVDLEDFPDKGMVRRELYPWNDFEPSRFSEQSLKVLHDQLRAASSKLEVKVTELPALSADGKVSGTIKQLGLFATDDVAPGELVLEETSLLTSYTRLHDSFCDACSTSLPDLQSEPNPSSAGVTFCPDCDDTVFCSPDCYELALNSYHPILCGKDIDTIAKGVPAAEADDALYSLLLLRAFALAETQEKHPLELWEVQYIWGDYHSLPIQAHWKPQSTSHTCSCSACPSTNADDSSSSPVDDADPFNNFPRTLRFSFKYNIFLPLHMLEKLDLNIFTSPLARPWIFNTLYAKFRGTASARQGLDGRPEVGAVHPLWCLANHSCDPNARWAWEGKIRFWAREERVRWKWRKDEGDGEMEWETKRAGLRKGEELLSHYCDLSLPVNERRAWAIGALGGLCRCERCEWEERAEKERGGRNETQDIERAL